MFRYVVWVWEATDPAAVATVETHRRRAEGAAWRCAWERAGTCVYVSGERPGVLEALPLPQQRGVLLGAVYSREGEDRGDSSGALTSAEGEDIARYGLRRLLERYWGRYVAILAEREGPVRVLRDPSGALPALYTTQGSMRWIFSDLDALVRLFGLTFSINWDYVAAYVAQPYVMSRETGLRNVSNLLQGECLHFLRGGIQQTMEWTPFDLKRLESESFEAAASQARHTLQHCIGSLARRHSHVLHRLSGGLDSSMVAACLAREAHTTVTSMTYFGEGIYEDERFYARLLAERFELRLIEVPHAGAQLALESLRDIRYSPRPEHYLLHLEHVPLAARLAQEYGATAVFDGAGGDALFFQQPGALAAIDRIRTPGHRTEALHAVLDAARIEQNSVWGIAREALQGLGSLPAPVSEHHRLFRPAVPHAVFDAFGCSERFAHPWLERARKDQPGKWFHVSSSAVTLPFYEPYAAEDAPDAIHPILSQPVQELFYRLPLALLIRGGWDRAVVRRAFESILPVQIVRRRGKGASTTTLMRTFEAHRQEITDMLLSGALVRAGLLEKTSLSEVLSGVKKDVLFAPALIDYLPTEIWLRKCEGLKGQGFDSSA